jgi:acetolactate synthase-1/3 small subunit
VFRDLAMIKVAATPETRAEIMQLTHVFRARIVDVNSESMVIETTGAEDKIDGLVEILRGYGILEMARTGRVAMTRGPRLEASANASGQDDSLEDESVSYSV